MRVVIATNTKLHSTIVDRKDKEDKEDKEEKVLYTNATSYKLRETVHCLITMNHEPKIPHTERWGMGLIARLCHNFQAIDLVACIV